MSDEDKMKLIHLAEAKIQQILLDLFNDHEIQISGIDVDCRHFSNYRTHIWEDSLATSLPQDLPKE